MRCASPILGKGSTKVNPTWVPCSRCGYCLRTRQLSWSFRLTEEMEQSRFPAYFITLTYDELNIPFTLDDAPPIIKKHFAEYPNLSARDVQLFTKSLRKLNKKHTPFQYRYYCGAEYAERFGRPHYHIIAFNLHPKTIEQIPSVWHRGRVWLEPVKTPKNVSNYVAGYIVSAYAEAVRKNVRPFSLMSKKPYLGYTYVERMYQYHKKNQIAYLDRGKYKQALPRIFKQKIFEQWELNAMKQPAIVQNELRLEAELHRLYLLNPDLSPFNHYEKTRIYNEQLIFNRQKHNDHYAYSQGPIRRTSTTILEKLDRLRQPS